MYQVKGKLKEIGMLKSGVSKAGKNWQLINVIIDRETEYNNILSINIFGEEKINRFKEKASINDVLTLHFDIECREFNGKYYTNLGLIKFEVLESEKVIKDDDLPF